MHFSPPIKHHAWLMTLFIGVLSLIDYPLSADTAKLPSRLIILQYHHVGQSTAPTTTITDNDFLRHLDLIQNHGAIVVDIKSGLQKIQQTPTGLFLVAITFDDASDTLLKWAIPELQRREWPLTIFVNTLAVEQQQHRTLSWLQLRKLQQQGVIIANHSHRHQHLIEQADWWQDIKQAQQLLEQHVYQGQAAPKLLAFPFGEYNHDIQQKLQQHHWLGVSQQSGAVGPNSSPENLPRFAVSGIYANHQSFREKLLALPFPASSASQAVIFNQGISELSWQLNPKQTLRFNPSQLMCYHSKDGQQRPTIEQQQVRLVVTQPFSERRGKVNCTVPHRSYPQHYFWMSQLFINTNCHELGCD